MQRTALFGGLESIRTRSRVLVSAQPGVVAAVAEQVHGLHQDVAAPEVVPLPRLVALCSLVAAKPPSGRRPDTLQGSVLLLPVGGWAAAQPRLRRNADHVLDCSSTGVANAGGVALEHGQGGAEVGDAVAGVGGEAAVDEASETDARRRGLAASPQGAAKRHTRSAGG